MQMQLIMMVDVQKSFDGVHVLGRVNITVAEDSTCALMCVYACGKTVLLKHIEGLLRPDRREVWVDGHNLSELSERQLHELRAHTGVLFQSGALFDSLTVYENVAFPLREQLHLEQEQVVRRVAETLQLL